DALPDFRPSASTGHALADPAADHRYGAIGFEGEIPQMLNWESSTGNAYGTIIAIHSPSGSRLEVDSMPFYEAGGAYYESLREASAYGSVTHRTGRIPEFVSSPAGVFDGEHFKKDSESILRLFEETRRALEAGGGDVIGGGKTLGEVLRRESGWKVSPEFRDVRIEPVLRGASHGRVYTQFTVGVPVGGILHLLEQVASRRDRWQADELLEPSRAFGRILAEQFVVQYYRRSLAPGEIEGMRNDPLVREVWGYGWLLFNHVAAAPFHSTAKKNALVKNLLQVALRNPFGEVRKVLQEPVRQFLEHYRDGVAQLFQNVLAEVFRDAMLSWKKDHPVFSTLLAPGHTTGDYLSYGLDGRNAVSQSVGVGMSAVGYETLSEHHGTKLILLEVRKAGENNGILLPGEVPEYFYWLKEAVLPFFAEDQANMWRHALRAYPDLAGLNVLEYREGTPLWHALKRVADMGRSPDPKSREIVAFVAQKLREGVSGPSGGDVVVRRAEVGGVLEGLRRVYADKGLSVKARAVLGGILASWESNAGMPVLPPGVVRVPSALPEDLALVSGPSRSVRSVDAVLGRGVRVLDRAGLEAVAEQGPGPVARPAGGRPAAADAASEDLPDPHVLRARTAGAAGEPGRRQASPPRPIRFRERVALAVREWDKPLPEAVEDLEQLLRDAGQGARSLVLGGEPGTVLWAVNVGGEIQWKDRSLMPAQAPRSASGPFRSIDLTPSSELISPPQELLDAGGGATRFCQISPGAKLRGVM
ncbi:hypothetical protein ACIO8H_34500, partial [Streptomyces sp. NPDC087226]|uniref:hypothetical protein n=1 Tax=Streptomyces sp. NPDC087226 TaxID=3365771 RepID=UPI00382DAC49